MMKNVLFLLDYYLPNASANGICIAKVVDEFKKKGVNVSLLCLSDKTETAVRDGVKIYKVSEPPRKKKTLLSAIGFYAKWLLPTKYPVTARKPTVKLFLREARKIVVADGIDTLVSVHLPGETLIAAGTLKKEFPQLCTVAYMLDSLSGGFLPKFLPSSFCRRKKVRWENRLLAPFDRIVLMESSRAHHEKYSKRAAWYQKATFLDVPALVPADEPTLKKERENGETVFSFVGTMSDGVRTPYALLKVLSAVTDQPIRFVIAGKNGCGDLHALLGDKSSVVLDVRGEIPYEQAQQLLADSDVLVNLGNVNPYLVPSKIFEYMSCGKPIVTTYTCDTDSSLPYLEKYPAVCFIDERDTDFAKNAARLALFIKENRQKTVPFASLARELYTNTPAALYDLLSSKNE